MSQYFTLLYDFLLFITAFRETVKKVGNVITLNSTLREKSEFQKIKQLGAVKLIISFALQTF